MTRVTKDKCQSSLFTLFANGGVMPHPALPINNGNVCARRSCLPPAANSRGTGETSPRGVREREEGNLCLCRQRVEEQVGCFRAIKEIL